MSDSLRTPNPTNVTTGKVRFSFVNIFQPKAFQEGGEPKYSLTILIPKTDTVTVNKLKAAVEAAKLKGLNEKLITTWGEQQLEMLTMTKTKVETFLYQNILKQLVAI